MALPRVEKAYEKYAWILLFVPSLLTFIVSVFNIIVPAPIDATTVKNLTGFTWEQIVSQSPVASKLTSYFVAQFGVAQAGFSIFTMGISVLGFRKGERWAWYVLWFVPIVGVGYVVTNLAAGTFWIEASMALIIAPLGLPALQEVLPKETTTVGISAQATEWVSAFYFV